MGGRAGPEDAGTGAAIAIRTGGARTAACEPCATLAAAEEPAVVTGPQARDSASNSSDHVSEKKKEVRIE